MTNCRTILRHAAVLAVLAAFIPAVAHANPLLSGYGGPGQGSQAILGAALVNPPAGGGGGTSAGGGGSSLAGASPGVRSGAVPHEAGSSSAPAARTHGSRASGGVNRTVIERAAHNAAPPRGEIRATSDTLGLTGADLAYLALVLFALVATAALTRRLARPAQRGRAGS